MRLVLTLFIFLILSGCFKENYDDLKFMADCQVINFKNELVRRFPGNLCSTRRNYLLMGTGEMKLLEKNSDRVVWNRLMEPDHHIELFEDESSMIAVRKDLDIDKFRVATNQIFILDKNGKTKDSFYFHTDLDSLFKLRKIENFSEFFKSFSKKELADPVSFFRINAVLSSKSHRLYPFKDYEYLITFQDNNSVILYDHKNKKVKELFNPGKKVKGIHTPVVGPDGKIYFFANTDLTSEKKLSSIYYYDPKKKYYEKFLELGKGSHFHGSIEFKGNLLLVSIGQSLYVQLYDFKTKKLLKEVNIAKHLRGQKSIYRTIFY